MAIAPVVPWRKASTELLRERLFWPAWIATATLVLAVALGAHGVAPLIAFFLGGLAGGSAIRQLVLATRRNGWRGLVGRTNGGMIVHLGVVIIAVAIATSSSYAHQLEVKLAKGESATVAGHTVTFVGTTEELKPNRFSTKALVLINGKGPYAPALNRFGSGSSLVGTPSVRSTLRDDVMLTLLALPESPDAPVALRVIVQPMVIWLWIGGGLMALGTAFAAFPGRRRNPLDPVSSSPATVERGGPHDVTGTDRDPVEVA
jgi:cytochrome c-type biogenesis protein CcmF